MGPTAARFIQSDEGICVEFPSVLEDAIVGEQELLVSSLLWADEVAVAVFWCSPGAFHH